MLVVLRAAVSIAFAAAVTAVLTGRLSRRLDVETDIVGYPIHSNFNVNRYLWAYGLWVVFFPLLALVVDLVLARLTRRRLPRAVWPLPSRGERVSPPAWSLAATEIVRVVFVGTVLAIGVALLVGGDGARFLLVAVFALAVYVGGAAAAASLVQGLRGGALTFWERLAAVNLVAAPLTVLTLFALSQATEIRVLTSGRVYEYRWFPLWLAGLLTAVVLAVVLRAARGASGLRLRELERRAVLLVAAPVLLFVVVARLPGQLDVIDFFHEGELMATADLTAKGAVPWRDLIVVHGLLQDVISPQIGFAAFENTRWGYFAGALMIVAPLYFVSQYFLFVHLFGRNVLFLLGTQVAVVLGLIADVHFRFVLMPVALLLLAAVLRSPTWARAAALAAVLLAQAVLTPEAAVAVPAVLAVLAAFELSRYERARPFLANFRRTARTVASGAVGLALLLVFLAALGILDDFAFFYRTFLSGHALTGGIPIHWWDTRYRVAAIAPVVAVILAIWFFATAWRARRRPEIDDWVMGALALTVLLYYPKFLARADTFHVYHVFPVTVPLLAYIPYRALSLFENRRFRVGRSTIALVPVLTLAAFVVVALASPIGMVDVAEGLPERGSNQAQFDPVAPRLGFLNPLAIDVNVIRDAQRFLDTNLDQDDRVFDFSNSPLLFSYLIERRPSTRYFHVNMAMRQHTQTDLVERLERDPPKLVVFSTSQVFGVPVWDGVPNEVRHYDVSEYLMDNYRPLFALNRLVFYGRKGLDFRLPRGENGVTERTSQEDLYLRPPRCDWGYAPNFLSTRPNRRERALGTSVPARRLPTSVRGWAADLAARAPALEVVAAVEDRIVARAVPGAERDDVARALRSEAFSKSGFRVVIPSTTERRSLRIYALTRHGTAEELAYAPGSGLTPTSARPELLRVRGRTFRVIDTRQGLEGWAERSTRPTYVVELPSRASDYDWIEVLSAEPFAKNTFWISDRPGAEERRVSFKTLDRGRRSILIQAGACRQWQVFGRRLYVESANRVDLDEVRVMP